MQDVTPFPEMNCLRRDPEDSIDNTAKSRAVATKDTYFSGIGVSVPFMSSLLPPTFRPLMWKGQVLTQGKMNPPLECSDQCSLEELLYTLSREESLALHLECAKRALGFTDFCAETFFQLLYPQRLKPILNLYNQLKHYPDKFLDWCVDKKLNLKDFEYFSYDYKKERDRICFTHLTKLSPTKNQGLALIELYFDLLSLDKINQENFCSFKNPDKLLKSLNKLRFSKTLNQDQSFSEEIQKIEFGKNIKLKSFREGDRRCLQLNISADSPESLLKSIEGFKSKFKDIENIWKTK